MLISHLLSQVPYKKVPLAKVKLPKRKIGAGRLRGTPKLVPDVA